METFTNPSEGFSIFMSDALKIKTYTLLPDEDPIGEFIYTDTLGHQWTLRKGELMLDELDSMKYHYKGRFQGRFYKRDFSDSFNAESGEFYFKGK
jgi:hypothetical protein